MSNVEKTVMFALPNVVSGQLACVSGTAAGRSWDLSAGTFVIGRLDENDLALPQEPGVSKVHAKIIGQVDRYVIVDCESRNGTLLNGQLIQRADLFDGDEIRICGCTLRFTQKGGPMRPRPKEPVAPPPEPRAPDPQPTQTFTAPPQPTQPAVAVAPPPPATGRILATWYGAGLVASLLLGGAASAALVISAPETPVTQPTPTPTPTPTPVATPTPPAPPPAPPPAAVVDAGSAAVVDAGAAQTPEPPPPPPPPQEEPTPTPPPEEPTAEEPKKKKKATSSTLNTPTEAAPSGSDATSYPATVDGGKSETVKSRTGGRVKTVEAKDGDVVTKGQVLVTFESGADPAEIATLEDRIASLENAEDDEAKRELKTAKQKLAALEAGAKAQPITAGIDGKLTGFGVSVGAVLRANEAVGKIGDGDVPTRVRLTVPRGKAQKGQTVQLVLKGGGSGEGTVVSVSGKTVVVDTNGEPGDNVEAARF